VLRRLSFGLLVAGISSLACLLVLEVVLRVTGLQEDFFVQLDPDVGATYIPNKSGWFVFPDGRTWAEINSYGYLDQEWTIEKPSGVTRIVLLGDSYLAGMEVPVGQRASDELARVLNESCAGRKFEVLNFGVIGFGTAQELETLRHHALKFSPDLVALFVYTGNDLYNNSRELDVEPNRIHYEIDAAGKLERLPYVVRDNAIKQWLRHHSRAFLFLRSGVKRAQALHLAMMKAGLMQEMAVKDDSPAPTLRGFQYKRNPPPPIERAWRITEELIVETKRVAGSADAEFVVVVVPTKEEILDTVTPAEVGDDMDLQVPVQRLEAICEARDLKCLSLANAFASRGTSRIEDSFFKGGGHWTAVGHETAARSIFDWLRPDLCGRN